ncbi:MAG: T9SS type A sorting domain-containing protein [Flavobacteriales bacterium]|nr:T9SS type A sorting domain-containing protein [Flavobacteriales bacterium]
MDKSDLHVLDLSGRLVLSLTLRGTEQKIDVSNLSPGMYAVDLRANGIPLALGELIIE